jgi:hypothetical protein
MPRSFVLLALVVPFFASTSTEPTLRPQQSGTTARLQAVSAVSERVVWASGLGGTFVRTTDGGSTWHAGVVPGADSLEFRDVEGVSDKVAYLLAAGEGSASRIYRTENGGRTWSLQFQNREPKAFYDCFDFWSPTHGIAFSDAVAGRFPVILTTDGKTWREIGSRLPPAQESEAAFAASGTCVATQGSRRAWVSRVVRPEPGCWRRTTRVPPGPLPVAGRFRCRSWRLHRGLPRFSPWPSGRGEPGYRQCAPARAGGGLEGWRKQLDPGEPAFVRRCGLRLELRPRDAADGGDHRSWRGRLVCR